MATKKVSKKKSKKRDGIAYPGFNKSVNSRTRWEYLDQDYINKLSDKEKKFLSDFMCEFMSGNFQHTGKKLHKTVKERRECYTRNNARNRDVYTITKATGYLHGIDLFPEALEDTHYNKDNQEDTLIALIDGPLPENTGEDT